MIKTKPTQAWQYLVRTRTFARYNSNNKQHYELPKSMPTPEREEQERNIGSIHDQLGDDHILDLPSIDSNTPVARPTPIGNEVPMQRI